MDRKLLLGGSNCMVSCLGSDFKEEDVKLKTRALESASWSCSGWLSPLLLVGVGRRP